MAKKTTKHKSTLSILNQNKKHNQFDYTEIYFMNIEYNRIPRLSNRYYINRIYRIGLTGNWKRNIIYLQT